MGKPRNTQKYPTYPEIPEIPGNTRKKKRYPEIPDRIFRHSYPTRTRPATRYFVQYPTRPDPILKNPTRWALLLNNPVVSLRAGWSVRLTHLPSIRMIIIVALNCCLFVHSTH